jgi:hypothetical protein
MIGDAMSVITDSQPGDELVCIEAFHACPEGEEFRWQDSRKFRIGERVRYIDFFQNPNLLDNPVCWMVQFDALDGRRYSATQTYFVTVESWDRLKRYFARRLLREPKRLASPIRPEETP